MGYRVTYRYTAYPDCPEATEVSKSRAEGERTLSSIFIWGSLIALIGGIVTLSKNVLEGILYIVGGLGAFALYFFVISRWYTKNTQKMIEQAFVEHANAQAAARVKEQQEKEEKLRREKDIQAQISEATQSHDVDAIVKLNQTRTWVTNDQVVASLEEHRKWMADASKGKKLVLFGEEIRGVDLRNVCFEKAIFSHCIFYGLNLDGVHFRDCNLFYSRFKKCKLKNTSFDGSNMEGVRFD